MMYAKKLKLFKPTDYSQFFSYLTQDCGSLFEDINQHSFNQDLLRGNLLPEQFQRYLLDDRLYLEAFAKRINYLAKTTPKNHKSLSQFLSYLSKDIVGSEQNMHKEYKHQLKHMHIHQPGEAISEYMAFQKQQVKGEFAAALCCILPCFWIYSQLGTLPESKQYLENNPYKSWIMSYSSPSFTRSTWNLVAWICLLGHRAPQKTQEAMRYNIRRGTQLELKFFDEVTGLLDLKASIGYPRQNGS